MDDAPAIIIVDAILTRAIHTAVSDVHIESTEHGLRIRYRSDGMLHDVVSILIEYAAHVIARIKILARLDIAEKRIPQDGKFTIFRRGGDIDLRVATFPGLYGEKVVIRLLDRTHRINALENLGIEQHTLQCLRQLMQRAHGFFIVTGPTGSGKTTTLYALLLLLRSLTKNIVTLEDPVEYTITGITQGPINSEIGFDFATGIRALLRQDPDIIMVGEIRDIETAQVAVQAALTGHLVLSTLHTNNAPGAVIRLLDMNVKSFLINAAITGILAQRLVRVLCTACKYEAPLTDEEQYYLEQYAIQCKQAFRADGCARCSNTGYQGRTGVFELLLMTPQLRALIHDDMKYDELHQAARKQGMQPMIIDAMNKVQAGITSVTELMRTVV